MTASPNLLPTSWQRRVHVRRRLRQWSLLWMLVTIVGVGICGFEYSALARQNNQLKQLEREAAPLQIKLRDTANLMSRLAQLDERESLLRALDSLGRPLQVLGMISHSTAPVADKLRVTQFRLKSCNLPAAPGKKDAIAQPMTLVELRGAASDDLAVASFVDQIRAYGVFDRVGLISTETGADASTGTFSMECCYAK